MENKKYYAIIENSKGDDRRRHFNKKENKVIDYPLTTAYGGDYAKGYTRDSIKIAPA